jgi:NAD(P)-dependent dehydrogenase (short-subunit alcohol dehydrogenase family)
MASREGEERIVVITGVSRRAGIGFAVARRLLRDGARVLLHSFTPHDAEQPRGADSGGVDALVDELGGLSGELPYVISKGALHHLTRTLADELADRGITVNAINPGPVDTGWPSDQLRESLRSSFPAGRWGRPEDIAPIVAWMLSADSAWMTGQVIDAEGGFRRHVAGRS